MLNEKMCELGMRRSAIREIFEYGKKRAAEIGAENVFDFSLGNPSIPAPACVDETICAAIANIPSVQLHGYTSAQGDKDCRDKIAASLNARFGLEVSGDNLYLTCGAAACLTVSLHALLNAGDEVIVFAPFFPEYREFTQGAGGKLVVLKADENTFLPDFDALEKAINPKTKAVIINTPNNPSGVIYGEDTIKKLAEILKRKSEERGEPVYLVSDEPYRELVYDETVKVPFVSKYYQDVLVCYSYSKSLSLPGERIGYILVNPEAHDYNALYAAVCGAGRVLGFVCAPSLFQRVAAECDGKTGDLEAYKRNRDLLYKGMTECGFTCLHPDGAFYLFFKAPDGDAEKLCARAKAHELLLVSGTGFGYPGWVRVAYCVSGEQIERAMPKFKALAEEYGL